MEISTAQPSFGHTYDTGSDGFIVRHRDVIALGIRWFSVGWDKWEIAKAIPSHAFKILGEDKTIEAFNSGVSYGSLSAYFQDPSVSVFVRDPIQWSESMAGAFILDAPQEIGKNYNFALIATMAGSQTRLGSIINTITGKRRFTDWIDGIGDDKRKAICSQTVARLNNLRPELKGKGCLGWTEDQSTVKPNDLFQDETIYKPGAIELVPG